MDNTDIESTIKDIKTQCRLAMNGLVSTAMRERGIVYKLNFGVEYPRIREIARQYQPDHQLAQELWKSDIRELQIMAAILQPVETFLPEIAEIWLEGITNCELAEMTSMNLFFRLPYASTEIFKWIASENEMTQYCGYLTVTRLLANGKILNERAAQELLDQATAAGLSPEVYPRQGAMNALKAFAEQSRSNGKLVMGIARQYQKSEKPLEVEFYSQLNFAINR